MDKKSLSLIPLFLTLNLSVPYASVTRSQSVLYAQKKGWTTYYHVTQVRNIYSIKNEGLLAFYGGKPEKEGMSFLRCKKEFINASKNFVHVGKDWQTACRYLEHRWKLEEKRNPDNEIWNPEKSPILLKCDAHKKLFSRDIHDESALRTLENIDPSLIFVLVFTKGGDENKCFWLPTTQWDTKLYNPAFPDDDLATIILDEPTVRRLLKNRVEKYARDKLNKGSAAKKVGVTPQTLDKFLQQDPSLRISTKNKIICNFCHNFNRITTHDYHGVEF